MMMDMWNKSRFQVATSLLVALKTADGVWWQQDCKSRHSYAMHRLQLHKIVSFEVDQTFIGLLRVGNGLPFVTVEGISTFWE